MSLNNINGVPPNLKLFFKNINVSNGQFMYLSEVQNSPRFGFTLQENKYYTFIIVDPDAPIGYHIHQCIYNISLEEKGIMYYIYTPPSPPAGSGPNKDGKHRYFCIVYEQDKKIEGRLPFPHERGFENYDEFKQILGVSLKAIIYKYFVCQFNN